MKTSLRVLRLTSSEVIVTQVKKRLKNAVVLDNPISIITSPNMDGSVGISYVPWGLMGDASNVVVPLSQIIAVMKPSNGAKLTYKRYLDQKRKQMEFQKLSPREKMIALEMQSMLTEREVALVN